MVWIRLILFSAPLWVAGGVAWFYQQARELDTVEAQREDTDLIVAIRKTEQPGIFNPLVPSTGLTREITEMIFDRPFRRDDDLILRPHLVKAWEFRRMATFFFADEPAAEKADGKIEDSKELWSEWKLMDAVRDGQEIHVTFNDHRPELVGKLAEVFDEAWRLEMLHIRLTLKDAVQQSFENFMAGSIEKGKIQHFRYEGGRVADIYLTGETDLFLKELRLYYESNRNLDPSIEVMGKESKVSSLELILTLRDDVKWHDGEPFTSSDLVFTWEELARPGSAYSFREDFRAVDSVEKVGASVVKVKMREYFAPILESWEKLPVLPVHRLGGVHTPEEWQEFFKDPIGTGPYSLEERQTDGGVVLRANPDYYPGAPRQDRVVYRVEEDPEERLLAVRLGRFDVFLPDQREKNWIEQGRQVALVRDVPRFQNFVAWNLDRSLLSDGRIRNGLARAIDLETILSDCGDDSLRQCRSLFFPGIWFCEDSLDPVAFDPDAAAELFADAGWKMMNDRWHADGKPVEFKLSFDRANALHAQLAPAIAEAWEGAGIGVQFEPLDWNELITDRLATREFDGLLLGWELGFGRDQYAIWHSSEAVPGGGNISGLRNQLVDATLQKLREEDDPESVKRLAAALQNHVRELQPCLFLCEGAGSPMAIRRTAVRISRPRRDGTWSLDPVSVGRSGIFSSRPWWVRVPVAQDSEEPLTESPKG